MSPMRALPLTAALLLVVCGCSSAGPTNDSSTALTFTSDPSAGQLVCTQALGSRDLTLLQERSYQAILLFSWIRFDAPLPWTDKPLDAWFASAIHGIDFRADTEYSYCCEAGGVIVIQTNNLIVLMPTYDAWNAVSGFAALFIHEARHNEGYSHTCAGGNDSTIEELGAWSVVYYFFLWLATHTDAAALPGLDQLEAGHAAARTRASRFCSLLSPSPTP